MCGDVVQRTQIYLDQKQATLLAQESAHTGASRSELRVAVRPGEQAPLEKLSAELGCIPVTEEVARRAAEYARSYRRAHSGVADYLLAGTAAALDAELVTVNVKHSHMFEGLAAPYRYDA